MPEPQQSAVFIENWQAKVFGHTVVANVRLRAQNRANTAFFSMFTLSRKKPSLAMEFSGKIHAKRALF
jgi:hypothetical protein